MMRKKQWKGFTLLELICVLTALSIIMTVFSVLINLTFSLSTRRQEQVTDRQSQVHLLDYFRKDVKTYGLPEFTASSEKILGTPARDLPKINASAALPNPLPPEDLVLARWKTREGTLFYYIAESEFSMITVDRLLVRSEKERIRESFRLSDLTRIDFYKGSGNDAGLFAMSLWRAPLPMFTLKAEDLNPFTGAVSESLAKRVDPKLAANWKIAVVRPQEVKIRK